MKQGIYNYEELKGKIEVGDVVRALQGKYNPCNKISYDRSDTELITEVNNNGFYINGCFHRYSEEAYLEVVESEPEMKYKVGDILLSYEGRARKVLGVCGLVYSLSYENNFEKYGSCYTEQDLIEQRFINIKDIAKPSATITVLGNTYNKVEFEEAIKNLKTIN